MKFSKYGSNDFKDGCYSGNQRNIMAIIGNGFDIQVLSAISDKYGEKYSRGTRYSDFTAFVNDKNKNISKDDENILQKLQNNKLYKRLDEGCTKGDEQWSDLEMDVKDKVQEAMKQKSEKKENLENLKDELREIKDAFSIFLRNQITPEIIKKTVKMASPDKDKHYLKTDKTDNEESNYPVQALATFLSDLSEEDYKKSHFKTYQTYHKTYSLDCPPSELGYYTLYNWLFVNLNYTALFDNCFSLHKEVFDPHPHSENVLTNFYFHPTKGNEERDEENLIIESGDKKFSISPTNIKFSSYLISDIIHPHGTQWIPESMLFGFSSVNQLKDTFAYESEIKEFLKPYWSSSDLKYRPLFKDVDLFIIFGASLGESDAWWWSHIIDRLRNNDEENSKSAELIIYNYEESPEKHRNEDVKRHFIKNALTCCDGINNEDDIYNELKDKIFVVNYNDKKKVAFSFPKK